MFRSGFGAALVLLGSGAIGLAAEQDSTAWLEGRALEQQLAQNVVVHWKMNPLGRALKNLSRAERVAIVLDRRVDPDQLVSVVLASEPLARSFEHLADRVQLGYSQFGPIAYFGPLATARQLRTVAALRLEEAKKVSSELQRKLLRMRSGHWEELAQPRQLIEQLAAEVDLKLVGASKIPHDLWPAADLPPLTWIDRVTLLAAEFDLTYRIDEQARSVELVKLPAGAALARTYPARKDARATAKRYSELAPEARVTVEKNTIRVLGRVEDHDAIESDGRAKPNERTTVVAGKEVYQLTFENQPLEGILDQIAERLNLTVDWNRAAIAAAGIRLDQLVSARIKDASQDELFTAVLQGTGLTFRRQQREIRLEPAAKDKP